MFGEVAESYDRFRPGYPAELFDRIFSYAGLGEGAQLLESGAGTGKATLIVVPRATSESWSLTCVEPDPAMAQVLRSNLTAFPGLTAAVAEQGFEDFADGVRTNGGPRFHLLYAAQSWHWVKPDVRAVAAAQVLEDGGAIALIWNVARPHPEPLKSELDAVYARAPFPPPSGSPSAGWWPPSGSLASGSGVMPPASPQPRGLRDHAHASYVDELTATGAFGPVSVESIPWEAAYETTEWISLLGTHSDHRLLSDDDRRRLLEQVAAVLDANGGTLTVEYDTVALLAHRLPR